MPVRPPFSHFVFRLAILSLGGLTLFGHALSVSHAEPANDGTRQEPGLLQRIMNPDRTLRFEPSRGNFSTRGGYGVPEKSARARTFAFSRPAVVAPFRAKPFSGSAEYRAKGAGATDRSALAGHRSSNGFASKGRAFATRDVAPRADPTAQKAFPARPVTDRGSGPRPFLVAGKRQAALDEQSRARPMTIDEVRELLNKNR